ncbi:MAG: hypothetical protein HY720_28030 [Planctomycetes bacterium]|nr:hypothetical protein [Planctomycetota bacterium]
MTSREDSLFGRIAIDLGLVKEDQLREALAEQARSDRARLLGAILVEKGHITEEGLRQILLAQREKLAPLKSGRERRQEDASFGAIAVKEGHIANEDLDRALVEQFRLAKRGLFLKVGEILVKNRKMTEDQVLAVLRVQQNRFVTCPGCGSRYRVLEGKPGLVVPCKKCGKEIELGK